MKTRLPSDRVVAFVDILGFGDLVRRMFAGDVDLFSSVLNILRGINAPLADFDGDEENPVPWSECDETTAFSDSIVLSNAIRKDVRRRMRPGDPSAAVTAVWGLVSRTAWLSSSLLTRGILTRGGISIGPTYHRGKIVVGLGLLRAYSVEQSVARYPRIVLDDSVIAVLRSWTYRGGPSESILIQNDRANPMPQLRRDHDGCWYVDIFYHLYFYWHDRRPAQLARIREVISSGLNRELAAEEPSLDRLAKYRWLANEYNRGVAPVREADYFRGGRTILEPIQLEHLPEA